MDSSAPTILLHRVRVPSTPSTFFSFIVLVIYLSCEKNENKQKEAGFGPFIKRSFLNSFTFLSKLLNVDNVKFNVRSTLKEVDNCLDYWDSSFFLFVF